jgi:hypothetical protein
VDYGVGFCIVTFNEASMVGCNKFRNHKVLGHTNFLRGECSNNFLNDL